ncbi:MAG: hypothetical protein AAF335_02955 [Bacteroidota bacterium]
MKTKRLYTLTIFCFLSTLISPNLFGASQVLHNAPVNNKIVQNNGIEPFAVEGDEIEPFQSQVAQLQQLIEKDKTKLAVNVILFVDRLQAHLEKTETPAHIGKEWDKDAAASFVATIMRMIRKLLYPDKIEQAEGYGVPKCLMPFIKTYLAQHLKLTASINYPAFCRDELEQPLLLGKLGKLKKAYFEDQYVQKEGDENDEKADQ